MVSNFSHTLTFLHEHSGREYRAMKILVARTGGGAFESVQGFITSFRKNELDSIYESDCIYLGFCIAEAIAIVVGVLDHETRVVPFYGTTLKSDRSVCHPYFGVNLPSLCQAGGGIVCTVRIHHILS